MMDWSIFSLALPELILTLEALFVVLVAAFAGETPAGRSFIRTIVLLAYALAFAAVLSLPSEPVLLFDGLFITGGLAAMMKGLVLIGAFFASWMVGDDWSEGVERSEYQLLVLLATLGMLLMISAHDLISLYMAIEMQSLPLYVVAAMRTNSLRSSEAGLKYFLLGALSSGLLLYGASMIYGFAGSTRFDEIAASIDPANIPLGLTVGLVFLLSGLAFKISAAPFHMWTPDVYEGAPTPVTALFAMAPKVAAITLLMQVTYGAFGSIPMQWSQVLIALSVASMLVGALGAIMQTDMKRMMAFSSIAHMGYALAGLAAGTEAGASAVVIYMTTYVFMGAGAFSIILMMRRDDVPVQKITDLTGLSASHPLLAAAMMIVMFSMAGIPPLAGFFGKWYVFLAAVNAGLIPLAVIGVLTSVIGAFYYLRIIRLMYFSEADQPLDSHLPNENRMILMISVLVIVGFVFVIGPLREHAVAITQNIAIIAG
ncbi:MAG: NADH-quinone oxidoreductase subunit NuoN [Candidatus Puniceispirillaceae bacterium]